MRVPVTVAQTLSVIFTLMLAACGGGSDETTVRAVPMQPPVPAPASGRVPSSSTLVVGVFGGTLSDEREYDLLYVVMRDGTKVGYFGSDWLKSFKFVDSWASDDSPWGWVSTDGLRSGSTNGYFRGEGAFVSASFDMEVPRLSGLITAGQLTTKTVAFGGGAIPGSNYRLDEPASITAIEGRWELVDSSGNWTPPGCQVGSHVTSRQGIGCSLISGLVMQAGACGP